ncbi:hypothetical protein NDS46_31050 (plasmid) [Paenibacillus thiaminolyticus]|uniref:hypothetical protein n=1 Tax=Paenibacillus thiaminolyticus TaxID=49283 RepID=UPI00232AE0FA|nr:hypothetical protein [Paenibacillus thiaminolyticus]WCF11396.1 hypothetical protein NDS46_31050 [Paenibacillus thiaminolyticus]
MEDFKTGIENVRDALIFDEDELEFFNRILARLEGYEMAYKVILLENERLKDENRILQKENAQH